MADMAEVVRGFWEHYRRFTSTSRADRLSASAFEWACDAVDDQVQGDAAEAFDLLVALADGAGDDAALAYLGAGPIEALLRYSGSDVVFDRVEGWARRNGNFRKALSSAWFDDDLPEPVAARLRALGDP